MVLYLHISAEHCHGGCRCQYRVAQTPPEVGEKVRACDGGSAQLHAVGEGEAEGDLLKPAADELQIKPCAAEPCGQVGQQRAFLDCLRI